MVLGLTPFETFLLFFFVILFVTVGSIVSFVVMYRIKWPVRVLLVGPVTAGDEYGILKGDRARLIGFGDGGEQIYYFRRTKRYRVAYGKFVGRNHMLWVIGKDGYWYNCAFENINKKLRYLGVMPIDRDMRYGSASLRKGIDSRWRSKTFFEKYGVPITMALLIFAIVLSGVNQWILYDKQKDNQLIDRDIGETNLKVTEELNNIVTKLANLQQGSGFVEGGG